MYKKDRYDELVTENPELAIGKITQLISNEWNTTVDESVKKRYREQYEENKERYLREMNEYKERLALKPPNAEQDQVVRFLALNKN